MNPVGMKLSQGKHEDLQHRRFWGREGKAVNLSVEYIEN